MPKPGHELKHHDADLHLEDYVIKDQRLHDEAELHIEGKLLAEPLASDSVKVYLEKAGVKPIPNIAIRLFVLILTFFVAFGTATGYSNVTAVDELWSRTITSLITRIACSSPLGFSNSIFFISYRLSSFLIMFLITPLGMQVGLFPSLLIFNALNVSSAVAIVLLYIMDRIYSKYLDTLDNCQLAIQREQLKKESKGDSPSELTIQCSSS